VFRLHDKRFYVLGMVVCTEFLGSNPPKWMCSCYKSPKIHT